MKKQQYEFSAEKDQKLINERQIGFKEIIAATRADRIIDVLPHPNPIKYPAQKMYVVNINDYAYAVPFVKKDENTVFLKTIFPHRKLTKRYLKGE